MRLRATGVGRREAAKTAGASRKSAYLWENGLIQVNGEAAYPGTGAVVKFFETVSW